MENKDTTIMGVKIPRYDLDMVNQRSLELYRTNRISVTMAWVEAVLEYALQRGLLKGESDDAE